MKNLLFILIVSCSLNGFGQDFFGDRNFVIEQFKYLVFEEKCDTITPASRSDFNEMTAKGNLKLIGFRGDDSLIICYDDTSRYQIKTSSQYLIINDYKDKIKYEYDYNNNIAWGGYEKYWKTCSIYYYNIDTFNKDLERMLSNRDNNWIQVGTKEYWKKKKLSFYKESGNPIKILIGGMKINYQTEESIDIEIVIYQEIVGSGDWKEFKAHRKSLKKDIRKYNFKYD